MKPNDTRSRVAIGLCVLRVASTTTGRLVPTHEGLPQDQEDRDPAPERAGATGDPEDPLAAREQERRDRLRGDRQGGHFLLTCEYMRDD